MPKGLRRRYGHQHLHFTTCSCYRRLPLLASVKARNVLVKILGEVRDRYRFQLAGYVVKLPSFDVTIDLESLTFVARMACPLGQVKT